MVGNCLLNRRLFKNEHFLAEMGLSAAFPRGNLAEGVWFTN